MENIILNTEENNKIAALQEEEGIVLITSKLVISSVIPEPEKNPTEERLLNLLKQFTAKSVLNLKSMPNPCNTIDNLGIVILNLFEKPIPKSYPWEQVKIFFSNPGIFIHQLRKLPDYIKNKQISENIIREIINILPLIRIEDIEIHKFSKELKHFLDFIKECCEFYLQLWPETKIQAEAPKRKFKIPQNKKTIEETQLQQQINKEKKNLIR